MVKDGVRNDRAKLARMARRLNARHGGGRLGGLVLMTDDTLDVDWAEAVDALRAPPEGVGRAVREARERSGVWPIEVPFALEGSVNRVPWMP